MTTRTAIRALATLFLIFAVPALRAEHRTTIVFFADHSIPNAQWSHLFATIHDELQSNQETWEGSATLHFDAQAAFELLRGDQMQPGIIVDSAISVYLHGNCAGTVTSQTRILFSSPHPNALGWVEQTHGQISPFIHVDCGLIAKMLRSPSHFVYPESNDQISLAIARVFLHEWWHITTQNPHHTRTGIAKSTFTVNDLIGNLPVKQDPLHSPDAGPAFIGTAHGK
jgi:hypothetical protein